MSLAELFFKSFRAMALSRDKLFLGLVTVISASCHELMCFDMWFFVLPVENALEAHLSGELFKVSQADYNKKTPSYSRPPSCWIYNSSLSPPRWKMPGPCPGWFWMPMQKSSKPPIPAALSPVNSWKIPRICPAMSRPGGCGGLHWLVHKNVAQKTLKRLLTYKGDRGLQNCKTQFKTMICRYKSLKSNESQSKQLITKFN